MDKRIVSLEVGGLKGVSVSTLYYTENLDEIAKLLYTITINSTILSSLYPCLTASPIRS